MLRRSVLPFLWCATAATLPAAEQRLEDVRLLAERRPTAATYAWDDDLGARGGAQDFSAAWAAGAGLRWGWGRAGSPHLLYAGGEALWRQEAVADGALAGPLGRLEAGYAYGLADALLLSIGPVAGLGWGRWSRSGGVGGSLALDGPAVERGLRGGLRWQVGERLSVQAEAGWLWVDDRLRGDGASLDLQRHGMWCAIGLAWTIEVRPRRLE